MLEQAVRQYQQMSLYQASLQLIRLLDRARLLAALEIPLTYQQNRDIIDLTDYVDAELERSRHVSATKARLAG